MYSPHGEGVRSAEGWVLTRTVASTIEHLKGGDVEALSLDYYLSETDPNHTGMDVLDWLEDEVAGGFLYPPKHIFCHSSAPSKRHAMQDKADAIVAMGR